MHLHLSDEPAFLATLDEAVRALDLAQIRYAIGGGLAAVAYGRMRLTHDIDVFVPPTEPERALEALAQAGFAVERTDPTWLYKAFRRNVMIDIIFRSKGEIYVDDEALSRARTMSFRGRQLRTLAPEDLFVMKAMAWHSEVPRHWHDAFGVLAANQLDWDYLLRRALVGPQRVLALLVLARDDGLAVPDHVLCTLASLSLPCHRSSSQDASPLRSPPSP